MVQWVKELAAKAGDLSLVCGTYWRRTDSMHVPVHTAHCTPTLSHTETNTWYKKKSGVMTCLKSPQGGVAGGSSKFQSGQATLGNAVSVLLRAQKQMQMNVLNSTLEHLLSVFPVPFRREIS